MMGGSPAKGWEDELECWLAPFLARLRRQAQRRWAPVYLKGVILPGERKSVEPMAARVGARGYTAAAPLRLDLALGHGTPGG
jgi:SRSO17 transposase